MPSITFTVTAAEATRVTAAAQSAGFPDAKSWIVAYVKNQTQQFEQNQNTQTFAAGYSPVSPA